MATKKSISMRKELQIAKKIENAMLDILDDKDQFRRHIVTDKAGGDTVTEEHLFKKADVKAVAEMIKAVKALEELKRSASGQTGENGQETSGGLVILPEAEEQK